MIYKFKYYLVFVVFFTTFSCTLERPQRASTIINYPNGKIKQRIIRVDSQTNRYQLYYESGILKSDYYKTNNLLNGLSKSYFPTGRLENEGNWQNGRRVGYLKMYDSTGYLHKMVEHIMYKDSSVSKPNQIFTFSSNGDTLLDQSFFYEYWFINDTLHGDDEYTFKVVLRGNLFKNALIRICDYDENFNLLPNGKCDEIKMMNYIVQASLDKRRYHKGENILRGAIINFDSAKSTTIYFERSFYVVD